tara:strand:+ start:653 stop:841 length:189 start_codon:yes stop_codon:yes gene_type:complete
MSYSVHKTTMNGEQLYITDDNKITCVSANPEFQQWLRDNQDNLPADIQAKVDDGTLTIQDAD